MKRIKQTMLSAAILLFTAACTNENHQQANKGAEKHNGIGEFTEFSIEDTPMSRTTAEYYRTGLRFFWTKDDKLWVNTGTTVVPNLKESAKDNITNQLTSEKKRTATAKFYFNGTFTNPHYTVRYTGKGNTVGDKVVIKAQQNQATPNDATHLGESGDCGTAKAIKSGGKYNFTLSHKAAYITFIPYMSQKMSEGIDITQIKLTADKPVAGTYNFGDDGLDISSPASTSNSITLTLNNGGTRGFTLPNSASVAQSQSAAIMVIAPDTYGSFTVEYTLRDPRTSTVGSIVKKYKGLTLHPGKNRKIEIDLKVPVIDDEYYMWDAAVGQHFWKGYAAAPKLNGRPGYQYPKTPSDLRWYNTAVYPTVATRSAAKCPNVNEMCWYVMRGNPCWDSDRLWVTMGYMYKGGVWVLKKAHIPGFTKEKAHDNHDYRITANAFWRKQCNSTPPANTADYFFLPLAGAITIDSFHSYAYFNFIGSMGTFHSSSLGKTTIGINPYPIFVVEVKSGFITVSGGGFRRFGFKSWEFE